MNQNDHSACHDDIITHVRDRLDGSSGRHRQRDTPITTLTFAQSIDGCIAHSHGGPLQLSNPESQKLTHQVRALHDAILVGISTVLHDNPQLTVRLVGGVNPQPVVVDSQLRFPLNARLMQDPCVRPIIATGKNVSADKKRRLTAIGARVIHVSQHQDGLLDLYELFSRLRHLNLNSVMVEGGARIITSVLMGQLADQLLLTISPRFVGGLQAIHPSLGSGFDKLPGLRNIHYQSLAGDLILRGDLDRERESPVKARTCQGTAGATINDTTSTMKKTRYER